MMTSVLPLKKVQALASASVLALDVVYWKRYRRWLRRKCALYQKVKKLYLGKVLEKSDFLSYCLREDSYKRENHEKIVCKYCKIAVISYIRTDL